MSFVTEDFQITILGHATMCALTGPLGVQRELPCVAVDEGQP